MKPKHLVFPLLMVLTFMVGPLMAQCDNKISVSSKVNKSISVGSISVGVESGVSFKCVLVIETAVGDTLIDEKNGSGDETIKFSELKLGVLYSVKVIFSNQEDLLCSKLTKTILLK